MKRICIVAGFISLLLGITVAVAFRVFTSGGQPALSSICIDTLKYDYAQNLEMFECEYYRVVRMCDPWDRNKTLKTYVLVDRNCPKDEFPTKEDLKAWGDNTYLVTIPLQHAVVATSCHAYVLDAMGATPSIAGVCDAQYMHVPAVSKAINSGKIADVGNSMNPNIEKIIEINTDALLLSPFQNSNHGELEKLNIPIIECADYMEVSPLARAEWMKFFGLLFGCEEKADELFATVEKNYLRLSELVASEEKPTVFVDKLYGNVWYQPNGHSTVGILLKDAGGDFVFKYMDGTGSTGLTAETVFDKAATADFWLIKYGQNSDLTYEDLRQEHALYPRFKSFEKKNVWGVNVNMTNLLQDYPFRPDYYLEDCIRILHPEVLPEGKMRYFKPVK